jgi:hypothetical protein
MGGRCEPNPIWGEEDEFNVDEENERAPCEGQDERLVLGSGWLYRQDFNIEQLEQQQDSDAIAQYLSTVDEVLFSRSMGSGVKVDRREKLGPEVDVPSRVITSDSSFLFLDSYLSILFSNFCRLSASVLLKVSTGSSLYLS